MGFYDVVWRKSAKRDIKKVDPRQIPRITEAIRSLEENPFPSNALSFWAQENSVESVLEITG